MYIPRIISMTPVVALVLLMGTLTFSTTKVHGAILAYDGFAAGGTNPTDTQYQSSGGHTVDALAYFTNPPNSVSGGQAPITHGFTGAWYTPHNTSGSVYARAEGGSLNYTSTDGISLITTTGSARIFRSGSNAEPPVKSYERNFDVASPLPTTLYFSVLVNFSANQPIQFQTQTLGENYKEPFGFGINSSGIPYLNIGSNITLMDNPVALAAGETHLLVMKVVEAANPVEDSIYLYVNPLLGSEELNTPVATMDGNFYVANFANYELSKLTVTGTPNNGHVIFDEFKVSTAWSDIASAVPEPSRMAMLSLFATLALLQRRRAR